MQNTLNIDSKNATRYWRHFAALAGVLLSLAGTSLPAADQAFHTTESVVATGDRQATLARSRYFQTLAFWYSNRPLKALDTLRQVPENHRRLEWAATYHQLQGGDIICYGHAKKVYQVKYSPDGSVVASAGEDNQIRIWNPRTGQEVKVLRGLNSSASHVYRLAFSPDGSLLAAVSGYNSDAGSRSYIELWDTQTWKRVRKSSHSGPIDDMFISSDGKRIVFTPRKQSLMVWDITADDPPRELVDEMQPWWYAMALSHNGSMIATVGDDTDTIRLWTSRNGELIHTLKARHKLVFSLSFSPSDAQLVTASRNGEITLWDTASGAEIKSIEGGSPVAFTPDGRYVIGRPRVDRWRRYTSPVLIWNLETGEASRLEGAISAVRSSPDSSRLAGYLENQIRIWDIRTGEEIGTLPGYTDRPSRIEFSPDGSWIATAGSDHTVRFWDTRRLSNEWSFEPEEDEGVQHTAFSPDGRSIAIAGSTVQLRDAASGRLIRTMEKKGADDEINKANCLALSPDGSLIAVANKDKSVFVWEAATGKQIATLDYDATVTSVAFSHDGGKLVAGDQNLMLQIRNWRTGERVKSWQDHTIPPRPKRARSWFYQHGITCSPDGRWIASLCDRVTDSMFERDPIKDIRIWNATSGELAATLKGHEWAVSCLAFSPNSRWLVSGGRMATIRLWDLDTREEHTKFVGHNGPVHGVAFSADGTRIVSTAADETVRIWDASDGEELKVLGQPKLERFSYWGVIDQQNVVAVSNEGQVFGATAGNRVRRWSYRLAERVQYLKGPGECSSLNSDASLVATGNSAGMISVWDVVSGRRLKTLRGHTGPVSSVAFSADSRQLVSTSKDETVKIWDLETESHLRTIKPDVRYVRLAAFHPDGKTILAESYYDGQFSWDIETGIAWKVSGWPAHPFDGSHRSPWQMKTFEGHVVLNDLHFRQNAQEVAWLTARTAADPRWHRQQAQLAEENANWFAAAFHRAWELKTDPDSPEARHALRRVHKGLISHPPESGLVVPNVVVEAIKSER